MTFCLCRKDDLVRKRRLISKFVTSQSGYPAIAIHILPIISRSKSNQTMKFGQLIGYKKKIFFFKNYAENKAERLVRDFFLFMKYA